MVLDHFGVTTHRAQLFQANHFSNEPVLGHLVEQRIVALRQREVLGVNGRDCRRDPARACKARLNTRGRTRWG